MNIGVDRLNDIAGFTIKICRWQIAVLGHALSIREFGMCRIASGAVIAHHQKLHEGISDVHCGSHVRVFCVLAIRKSVDSSGA